MITHPEKVLFPDVEMTKGDVAAYYDAIAPLMVAHIRNRPVTMERFPAGINKDGFIQKDVTKGFPEWLKRVEAARKEGGVVHYPLANDRRSLLWLANQNTIAIHVWASRAPRIYAPDVCVWDLDPSKDEPEILQRATLAVRDVLAELGYESWVKTSGSKGFHVLVRLKGRRTYDSSSVLADAVARAVIERWPDLVTQAFSKAGRGGKIFIDTARNRAGATFVAPYSIRAKPGAPVSAPCTWDEIERGKVGPQTFTVQTMRKRIEAVGDLWTGLLR